MFTSNKRESNSKEQNYLLQISLSEKKSVQSSLNEFSPDLK